MNMIKNRKINLIVAMDEAYHIGNGGKLPAWDAPGDLNRFRRLTMGRSVIMGRKTYESIGKPLDGRHNVVLSKTMGSDVKDIHVARDRDAALKDAFESSFGDVWVIGGAEIYQDFLPIADRLYVTRVHGVYEGDKFFPRFDQNIDWKLVWEDNLPTHSYQEYIRERKYKEFMKEEMKEDTHPDTNQREKGTYEALGQRVGSLVDVKNKAYGSSFDDAGDFLKLLYPNGIQPNQYGDALALVRIFDKIKRIATDRDALGESPYQDIAGYGLLGLQRVERARQQAKEPFKTVNPDPLREKESYPTLGDKLKLNGFDEFAAPDGRLQDTTSEPVFHHRSARLHSKTARDSFLKAATTDALKAAVTSIKSSFEEEKVKGNNKNPDHHFAKEAVKLYKKKK